MKTTPAGIRGLIGTGILVLVLCATVPALGSVITNTVTHGTTSVELTLLHIGNAGNAGHSSHGFGGVEHGYYIGQYAITRAQWDQVRAASGNELVTGFGLQPNPVGSVPWYDAARFANWLTSGNVELGAYTIQYDHEGVATNAIIDRASALSTYGDWNVYVLPNEDEWYKAAYHKNDGATANYWLYATGSDTRPTAVVSGTDPDTAVYRVEDEAWPAGSAAVDQAGGLSPYGTMGQGGNAWEWMEGLHSPGVNLNRIRRGGAHTSVGDGNLRASARISTVPTLTSSDSGFRIALIPEPSAMLLLLAGGAALLWIRRRKG